MKFIPRFVAVVISCLLVCPPQTLTRASAFNTSPEAQAALAQARDLFNNNNDAAAFAQLDAALKLFAHSNDTKGQAAVQDLIGEIYTRAGQYEVALKQYTLALEGFKKLNDTDNADATLLKIGDTNLLLGNHEAASLAYTQVTALPPDKSAQAANQKESKAAAGGAAAASNSVAGFCQSIAQVKVQHTDPKNPANMGRAPRTPNGVGRMDLRVTDEQGNPLKGIRAQIKSKRPGGLFCECFDSTNDIGRALMPPLHIAKNITLVLKGQGATHEIPLADSVLDGTVRVTFSKAGASLVQQSAQAVVASPVCFNFYRSFLFFAGARLGRGRAEYEKGNLDAAKKSYSELVAGLEVAGLENLSQTARLRAAALTALGDIALKQGSYDEAIKLFTVARDKAKADDRLDLMWAAQRGIGRSLWLKAATTATANDAGRWRGEALVAYRDALKTIEAIRRNSLRADESRTSFLAKTKDVYTETAVILATLALNATGSKSDQPFEGYAWQLAQEAYRISEMGRARSLLDMMDEARILINTDLPAEAIEQRKNILARQAEILSTLNGIALAADTPKQKVAELELELDTLSNQLAAYENQMRLANPRYANVTTAPTLNLADTQTRVLDADTVLIEYLLSDDVGFAFVVTKTTLSVFKLAARDKLEHLAREFRAQLIPEGLRRSIVGIDTATGVNTASTSTAHERDATTSNTATPASFATAANNLYAAVFAPLAPLVVNKRLLIVADGALNFVPFEALVSAVPTTEVDYATLPFLIKTNEIVYAPSASALDAIRTNRRAASSSNAMLVVADPVFSLSDARVKSAVASASVSGDTGARTRGLILSSALADVTNSKGNFNLVRLLGTRNEATEINNLAKQNNARVDSWLDFDANKQNVTTRDLTAYRAVHFATHGLLNTERPQFTGLALTLVGNGAGDGFLRANEVFNLKLNAPLVMLSACETGLGREARGEGVIGLTRAFLYAGAPQVGVSLWSVSDRSTARLMTDFYKQLFALKPAPHALRASQLAMIDNPRYNSPFFWAAFVMVGDWK